MPKKPERMPAPPPSATSPERAERRRARQGPKNREEQGGARTRRLSVSVNAKRARRHGWIEQVSAPYRFPADIAEIIRSWGVSNEKMQPLVEFVQNLRFQAQLHRDRIAIGKQVQGWTRHSQRELPEDPGLLARTTAAVAECITAIDRVLAMDGLTLWVTDPRIAKASPPLKQARAILSEPEAIEIFPDHLPPRKKGRKPPFVIVLQEGKNAQPLQEKTLLPALRRRLRQLCPAKEKRAELNRVAARLAAFILPQTPA